MGLDEYGTAHQVAIQIHDAVRYVLDVLWGEVVFEHPGIGVSSRLYGSYIIGNAEDGRVEDAVGILYRLLVQQVARLPIEQSQRREEYGHSHQRDSLLGLLRQLLFDSPATQYHEEHHRDEGNRHHGHE